MAARSATAVCNCGGYHLACRLRDLDHPGADPALPAPVLRNEKAFARTVSDASTAVSESDRRTREAASGAATDSWEMPAIPEPPQGGARKDVGSRFILGDGDCTCGGYHVSCRPCSPELSDIFAASWRGDLEHVSVVLPDGIRSDVVLGADICTCGGYHLACRLGSQNPSMATSAWFSKSGSGVDEQMPAGISSKVLVGVEATVRRGYHRSCQRPEVTDLATTLDEYELTEPLPAGISSKAILGDETCVCGGYHRSCAYLEIGDVGTTLVDHELIEPMLGDIRSKIVLGDDVCACGGYHLACRLSSDSSWLGLATPALVGPEPVNEESLCELGICSKAILGDAPCVCGGYHLTCRLGQIERNEASTMWAESHVSTTQSEAELAESSPAGIMSDIVLGDSDCTCGGYHLACRLGSTNIIMTNSDLVEPEPAVEDPLQIRVDSKTVLGGVACACGGHHLLCRLGDSERTRDSEIPLQSEISEPVQEGISSQAILGDIFCKCGGYHLACRLDIPELSDAIFSLLPVVPTLQEPGSSGISSEAVLGDTACTCGGYHLSCRL